jgi:hypothetical protein
MDVSSSSFPVEVQKKRIQMIDDGQCPIDGVGVPSGVPSLVMVRGNACARQLRLFCFSVSSQNSLRTTAKTCDLNHRLATFEPSFGRSSSRVSPLNPNHRQSPIPRFEPSFGRKYRFRTIRWPRVHSGRSAQSVPYLPRSSPFSVVSKKMPLKPSGDGNVGWPNCHLKQELAGFKA